MSNDLDDYLDEVNFETTKAADQDESASLKERVQSWATTGEALACELPFTYEDVIYYDCISIDGVEWCMNSFEVWGTCEP